MNDTDTERVAAIRERAEKIPAIGYLVTATSSIPGEGWPYTQEFAYLVHGLAAKDIPYLLTLVSQLQAQAEEQTKRIDGLEFDKQHLLGLLELEREEAGRKVASLTADNMTLEYNAAEAAKHFDYFVRQAALEQEAGGKQSNQRLLGGTGHESK